VYYADAGCAGKAAADELDDRVDTLCRGLLGLTVSCARCHDHKFDPISTHDYYALAGVFASTQYQEAPLAPREAVQRQEALLTHLKALEKQLADAQAGAARKLGESFASQTAKYAVAAWKLRQRRQSGAKLGAAAIAAEAGLHPALVERWVQFLSPENVRAKPYLAGWIKVLEDGTPRGDESARVAELCRSLQSELIAALAVRDRRSGPANPPAGATPAKQQDPPKLDARQASLLADVFVDKNAPFALPKDLVDQLLPAAEKAALATQQQEIARLKQELPPKFPVAHSLAEGPPTNLKIHVRGNHKELGEEVARRFLAVLSRKDAAPFRQGSGRLELAQALVDPANPLTARVIVNRVWHHHFGRGLVGTPSNFGLLGERPTHPELLDHLAAGLVASGWSLKQLHRVIMLSATYRLASDDRPAAPANTVNAAEIDPDNRLLWRQNRRRLDIEAWRDATLAASGNLELTLGGPPTNLADGNNRRRTLYAAISRHDLNGTLRLFDFPDPNLTSERRANTTVPMQQLFVLNSDFVIREAKALAARAAQAPTDEGRITRAYRLLFQRDPGDAELRLGLQFLQSAWPVGVAAESVKLTGWEQYAQALLGTNEFAFVD